MRRQAEAQRPSCLGDPQRGHRRRHDKLGAGGGFEELLRESQSRLGSPVCRASSRRSAPDQFDPALVESGRFGRRSGPSERTRNPTRRIDQRAFEQSLPSLRAGPLVRARCEGAVAGRSPTGTLYRRLCDLLPISLGRHPRTGRPASTVGKIGLTLEPTKTKLVEFGRFAQKHAGKRGRNRPETIYFLGLTLYCTRNQKG